MCVFYCLVCYSFIFLFLENYGVRSLEAFFAVLIGIMAVAFGWMFSEAKPSGKELLVGKDILFLFISLI
jgi:natural resistance-associated macrophage protein